MSNQTQNSIDGTTSKENVIESLGFLGTITVFFVVSLFTCLFSKETISAQENRALASFPSVHSLRKDIPKFTLAFELYFKDRIPLRLPLITAKNWLTLSLFHTSGNPLVAVGKQNWLFYNSYGVTPAQLNLDPFTPEELQVWARDIEARKSFLDQHHIKYLLVFAPEKGSMYPELLPSGWLRRGGITRLEQLQAYLKKNSSVNFVDAKGILDDEKRRGQKTYHSNDTHWNQRSAFLISQSILDKLHDFIPSVASVSKDRLLTGQDHFVGDLAKMLGLQKTLTDVSPSIVVNQPSHSAPAPTNIKLSSMGSQEPAFATVIPGSNLPRALVLRDSFCTYLTAPLSEHFSYAEYQWTNDFQTDAIVNAKPDLLINEIAERHLYEEFHEHVPVTVEVVGRQPRAPICTFGNSIELLELSARRNCNGLMLTLRWHSKKPTKLDYTVGLHCLDSNKRTVGGADYQPDIVQRTMEANTYWVDSVDIPDRELKNATQLGVLIYHSGKASLTCDSLQSDWNMRYVLSLSDLERAGADAVKPAATGGADFKSIQ